MLKKASIVIMAFLRGVKCPDCKSRSVILEESSEIDPARLGAVLVCDPKSYPDFPILSYRSMSNCYQKIAGGDIFKMYRDAYRCMQCNREFKKRSEILVARVH